MAKRKTGKARPESGNFYLDDESRKKFSNRLARIEGHIHAVRQMVDDRRHADEVLLQVAAVKAALNKFAAVFIEHELKTCVNTCMPGDRDERLDKVTKVLTTMLKQT
ncbi:MAG: metal-sensitive transcriptional regulator [Mariprofundaceae bacterium]|nr:metal-sensitive transcriptional regulator [Mariprofundaceae bacterium]